MVRQKQMSPIFMSSPECSSVEYFSARSQSSSDYQSVSMSTTSEYQRTTQMLSQTITQDTNQNLSENSFESLSENTIPNSSKSPQKTRGLCRKSTTNGKQLLFPFRNKKGNKKRYRRRQRSGTIALRDIRRYQNSAQLLIPSIQFQRLVRQICHEMANKEFRFQTIALLALQEASEVYITGLLEDSNLCAIHTGRVTVMGRDLILALRLRKYSKI